MFTGIIEKTAHIESIRSGELILSNPWPIGELSTGQSIAIDGCCLTLTRSDHSALFFHVSPETLEKTSFKTKTQGQKVNLERALSLSNRLDGHIVTGHIDSIGNIQSVEPAQDKECKEVKVTIPEMFSHWIATKGSVALDGVSLTINDVRENTFSVMLIPHTMEVTTWKDARPGRLVNVEFDVIAKYVDRIMEVKRNVIR